MEETQEQYLARKAAAQQEQWTAEYKAIEEKRLADALQATADAKLSAEIDARVKRMDYENAHLYVSPPQQVTCSVCGVLVVPTASSHVSGNNLCIRNPRAAKACGRISRDAYELLTDDQRKNGYIVKEVAMSTITDGSTGVMTVGDRANLLAGNVIDPALRR
jgi:hypothetical protein